MRTRMSGRVAGESGRPLPLCRSFGLPFHANDLAQSVDDFHEIALRSHDGFDGFVSGWRFVDDVGVLAAFDSLRHALVVFDAEAALGFRAGHGTSSAVATAHEAFHVAFAANDVGTRSHAARDDPHVAFAGAHGALARD